MSEQAIADYRRFSAVMLALVAGQCGLHACMAGMRVALPLQALGQEASKLALGVLVSCFAVFPAITALRFGIFTDRHGYRRPATIAALLSACGALTAFGATSLWQMFLAAGFCGTGAGFGMIAIQRTASRQPLSREERLQVFSMVALAPALGGLVGPIATGRMIDLWGYGVAYLALGLLPIASMLIALAVRVEGGGERATASPRSARSSFGLFGIVPLRRVMLLNLLVVASWDLHGFALPILGHERGFSATEIGSIFAAFGGASLLVRGVMPFVAKRISQQHLPLLAMVVLLVVFAAYPLLNSPWMMLVASGLFGVVVGITQPTIMVLLQEAAPADRCGEALAMRSMCNQASITILPLLYGVFGVVVGIASMFWLMALLLFGGVVTALKLR